MIEDRMPEAVAEAMQADASAVYLDVRTVAEFEAGHVPGALNIPILMKDPVTGAMTPNPEFLAVVTAVVPMTSRVFCGCASGPRSRHAAMLLQQHGYEDVFNVHAGFNGVVDPLGRVIEPGWAARGLPVEAGDGGALGYAALREMQGEPGDG